MALLRIGRRFKIRLRRGLSLGITARLAIAFVAVAILAVAANLVVERGVQVVRSTHLDRGQYSPVPESRSPSTAPLLHSAPANPTAGAPPRLVEPQIRRFVGAVDRFQSSTEVSITAGIWNRRWNSAPGSFGTSPSATR
jgi:hypothetical protein